MNTRDRERLLAEWSKIHRCWPDDLTSESTVFVSRPGVPTATLFQVKGAGPVVLAEPKRREALQSIDDIRSPIVGTETNSIGPVFVLPGRTTEAASAYVRQLGPSDRDMFIEFHESCSEQDRDEGQVAIEDPVVIGASKGAQLVAVATAWLWQNVMDIGVLVHPEQRGQGLGVRVVGALVAYATERGWTPQYRCDESNLGSNAIARRLGGEIFAYQREVTFGDQPP